VLPGDIDRFTVAGTVQAACLAHDIGNPPFGHSGEAAIGSWFDEYFLNHGKLGSGISDGAAKELISFEGNAQGFRILTRLEMYKENGGMQLSLPVLAAFQKYPTRSRTSEHLGKTYYVGLKKFGIFEDEWDTFSDIARKLGMLEENSDHGAWFRRHPLVYLVEAADDICYEIVDLEDAFTSGDLDETAVIDALRPISNSNKDLSDRSPAEQIAYLRSVSIGSAIDACVDAFKENYETIMAGNFNSSLIKASRLSEVFEKISGLASSRIFTAKRKTELEVSGRSVLRRVLTNLVPVYEELAVKNWDSEELSSHNVQIVRALGLELSSVSSNSQALHSLADFVSGMTDRYAVKVSKQISGIQ
jgi:dGTPase